jgi:drug/metabolite transporter (DMT)-like permease
VTAYLSMKTGNAARKRRLRQFAEGLFLFGLVLMAAVCVFLAVSLHHTPPGGSDWFSGSGPSGSAAAGHVAHVASPDADSSRQQ